MAILCYKPGPLVRSSRLRWLRGTVSSSRTPGLAGVQEQSFCRVRGSSQGYHVSVGLQLWAVGLALAIMPGDSRVHARRWVRCPGSEPGSGGSSTGSLATLTSQRPSGATRMRWLKLAPWWRRSGRSSDSSELYGAVASALDAPAPSPRGSAPRRPTTFMMRMAGKGRLVRKAKAAAAEKPAVPREDQVEALTEAFHCLASMRPRSDLTRWPWRRNGVLAQSSC